MKTKADREKIAAEKKAKHLINKAASSTSINNQGRPWDGLDKFAPPTEKYVQIKLNKYQWERLNFAATMSHRSMQGQAMVMMNDDCDRVIKKLLKN